MLRTDAAAELVGVTPRILSLWEQRFGYPKPVRRRRGEALYPDEMMVALRDLLGTELSVSSAVTKARTQSSGD
jgi:DNA-binding transcriptional MerR regulator